MIIIMEQYVYYFLISKIFKFSACLSFSSKGWLRCSTCDYRTRSGVMCSVCGPKEESQLREEVKLEKRGREGGRFYFCLFNIFSIPALIFIRNSVRSETSLFHKVFLYHFSCFTPSLPPFLGHKPECKECCVNGCQGNYKNCLQLVQDMLASNAYSRIDLGNVFSIMNINK